MVRFLINPEHVKKAVLEGKCLMVQVYGDRMQYRKVELIDRKDYPNMTGHVDAV